MAVDSPNNQELALKKRARRRLVGAIALVLFMVIILPKILQDRADLVPQEIIKISMPEETARPLNEPAANNAISPIQPQQDLVAKDDLINTEVPVVSDVSIESTAEKHNEVSATNDTTVKKGFKDKRQDTKPDVKIEVKNPVDNSVEVMGKDAKPTELKLTETKSQSSNEGSFTIQVGVFSDIENVKQLQARLKQVGLISKTENISTSKGQKIRLRAGNFGSRQEAAYALIKLQEADLSGMVISNN